MPAHFKKFSPIETSFRDYKLSIAYDLLNSRIHIEDNGFTLEDGLLPPQLNQGKVKELFYLLGKKQIFL
ncbi:hypothetical protein PG910_08875 [Tenacibaculum dicentrarchi]|nr:hypothetical protein PG910_08875 [Tenacibaculum dicentrarchi]